MIIGVFSDKNLRQFEAIIPARRWSIFERRPKND
jgi:hypothetical protein